MTVLVATVAGSIGALTRYLVSGVVQDRTGSSLPVGTATVNLCGALVLGLIVGASNGSLWWTAAAGFTGGLSTFSTWMVETVGLGVAPRPTVRATLNIVVLTVVGVALAALGYTIGR